MWKWLALFLILAGGLLAGCQTHTQEGDQLQPNTSGIDGFHAGGLPSNMSAPMPEGWHGFKAY